MNNRRCLFNPEAGRKWYQYLVKAEKAKTLKMKEFLLKKANEYRKAAIGE